ncbi:hypothetical protein [Aquimarina sp. 2201CG14-23]|uniref:hypothetical protein n=1 Tax=Aquimarina mycalae TaxID=3040073 RepID=UPI00247807E7|nr:hypothetical protein [Aquimarina sp. 2201CG14-23]MDH7448100.1 hypothetical protein [Aquimarina sp. 2201CG14-23]
MNNKQFTKFAIYAIAVLCAALIKEFVIKYVKEYIHEEGYLLVAIDMLLVILIFAPAFALVSKYTKKLSKVYLKTSKKVSSSKNGNLLGFVVAIIILFILFAYLRHNINVIQDLKTMFP